MAKVTDIQDKNGVSKEIQDKDLANRTSQSTVASTDYILLEDTDGAYHKIAKASFTEAVRGALGSVINSVAKGTDIAKVPVLDSNNDLGMGTLANLASVLGGQVVSSFPSHNDANLVTTPGLYATASGANIANLPRNAYGVLEVIGKANTTTQIQRFFTGGDAYYRRSENNNSAPYEGTTWLRIDNFGCNTPEALASLLGDLLCVRTVFHGRKNAGETINLGSRYGIFFFGNAGTGLAFVYVKQNFGWSKIYGSGDLNIDSTTNIYTVGESGFTGTISQFGSSSYT